MRTTPTFWGVCAALCLASAIPIVGAGEGRDPLDGVGGPLTGPPVLDAPFSADATTTARLTLRDGTRVNQITTARYYRDHLGRARVELKLDGREPQTLAERHLRTIVAPDAKDGVFTLAPATRTTRYAVRSWLAYVAGGESGAAAYLDTFPYPTNEKPIKAPWAHAADGKSGFTFGVPIRGDGRDLPGCPKCVDVYFLLLRRAQDLLTNSPGLPIIDVQDESLGSRVIADVGTIGRRVSMTIPGGQLGNDKPFTMVDERWESPELKLLVLAHNSDSRMGDVDYRLTNIYRVEPPADLFVVPPDYTVDTTTFDTTGTPHESWFSMRIADRYPNVGIGYVGSIGPGPGPRPR